MKSWLDTSYGHAAKRVLPKYEVPGTILSLFIDMLNIIHLKLKLSFYKGVPFYLLALDGSIENALCDSEILQDKVIFSHAPYLELLDVDTLGKCPHFRGALIDSLKKALYIILNWVSTKVS